MSSCRFASDGYSRTFGIYLAKYRKEFFATYCMYRYVHYVYNYGGRVIEVYVHMTVYVLY